MKLNVDSSDSLLKLREVHKTMFPSGRQMNGVGASKEYEMNKGSCFAWDVYTDPNGLFQITRWRNTAGSKFPAHVHDETECIVVKEGQILLHYSNGEEKLITNKEGVCNLPGQEHRASFPVETEYITIMIPASKDYPKAHES